MWYRTFSDSWKVSIKSLQIKFGLPWYNHVFHIPTVVKFRGSTNVVIPVKILVFNQICWIKFANELSLSTVRSSSATMRNNTSFAYSCLRGRLKSRETTMFVSLLGLQGSRQSCDVIDLCFTNVSVKYEYNGVLWRHSIVWPSLKDTQTSNYHET